MAFNSLLILCILPVHLLFLLIDSNSVKKREILQIITQVIDIDSNKSLFTHIES